VDDLCARAERSESRQHDYASHLLQSSVAAAAYRAGERLIDERYGTIHDYTHKDVVHSEQHALEEGRRVVVAQAGQELSLRAASRGIGIGR
jgi:hypothetical protein